MTINSLRLKLCSSKIRKLLKLYKVKRLALFGSYVNAKPKRDSDIDFLVELDKSADLFDLAGLKIALEEILRKKVDVVTPNALSKYFRDKVLKEAVYLT